MGTTEVEANKALARRLRLAPNTGDLDALDELATPELATVMRGHITAMRAAFPDVRYEIDDVIAEGDQVVVRWTRIGTHLGPFRGIAPTGRRATHAGVRIWRFASGRAVEMWGVEDIQGLLSQLTTEP